MTPRSAPRAGGNGPRRPPGQPEPLIQVGDDFEDEYPGASALATECYANLCRAGGLLMELHNRQTREDYQLSPSAREILAIIEGAGHASATGRFDGEQLFYLRSRGIAEDEARRLVVHGFFNDLIRRINVPELEEQLATTVEAELAKNVLGGVS